MNLYSVQPCGSQKEEMDPAKIRQSIEAIHATGYFADIRVEGFRQSTLAQPNGVRVLVTVKEKPVIRSVSIKEIKNSMMRFWKKN